MVQHEARQGSTHSSDILIAAKVHASMDDYLEAHGQGIKIAFSARDGVKKNVTNFSDRLTTLAAQTDHPFWNPKSQIQLHFGSEDDGLTLEELEPANFICRLPATGSHTSFNLSHAVLIALYILDSDVGRHLGAGAAVDSKVASGLTQQVLPGEALPAGRLEYPKKAIRAWLEALGFDLGSRKVTIETSLNRVLLSHCPLPEDVRLLEKVLFQTVEKLETANKILGKKN